MRCAGLRAGGERDDERAQQLALARSSRAGDEGVGPVADEVDLDDAVGGRGRAARPGAGRRRAARHRGGDGDGVVDRAGAVVRAELAEARPRSAVRRRPSPGPPGRAARPARGRRRRPWRSSCPRRARRRRRWPGRRRAPSGPDPIDPMSSTLRHIAGTASPGRHSRHHGRPSRPVPRNRRNVPVRWTSRSGRSVTTTT